MPSYHHHADEGMNQQRRATVPFSSRQRLVLLPRVSFFFLHCLQCGIPFATFLVRNTNIICHLKTPSLSSCKQISEAMNAFIEKENIKLGPQGTTPFVTEEKPAWRHEQQRTFGKALGVAEQLATMKDKYITSEWYPFYRVYVHESESAQPIPLLTTTFGVPVATAEGAELSGITADTLVVACRRGSL